MSTVEIAKQPSATKETQKHGRFHFIDDLRGIAAVIVAFSHLVWLLPFPFTLLEYGRLGVEIFFVISGFVMAYSLSNQTITVGFIGKFFIRRSIRLDPPYWTVIVIELVLLYLWSAPLPNVRAILLNLVYLQDITQVYAISSVAWTLCLELQFYLVFVMLLGLSRSVAGRFNWPTKLVHMAIFGGVAGLSILVGIGWSSHLIFETLFIEGFFLPYWHFFFAGVLVNWVLFGKAHSFWLWGYLAITFTAIFLFKAFPLFPYDDLSPIFGVFVSAVIYLTGRTSLLKNGLGSRVVSYFGRISYSLYLLHVPIGVNLTYLSLTYLGDQRRFTLPTLIVAFLASTLAAHLLYKYVEAPSVQLGIKAKSSTWPKFSLR